MVLFNRWDDHVEFRRLCKVIFMKSQFDVVQGDGHGFGVIDLISGFDLSEVFFDPGLGEFFIKITGNDQRAVVGSVPFFMESVYILE